MRIIFFINGLGSCLYEVNAVYLLGRYIINFEERNITRTVTELFVRS